MDHARKCTCLIKQNGLLVDPSELRYIKKRTESVLVVDRKAIKIVKPMGEYIIKSPTALKN